MATTRETNRFHKVGKARAGMLRGVMPVITLGVIMAWGSAVRAQDPAPGPDEASELAVGYASQTVYDKTPPETGPVTVPEKLEAAPILVEYAEVTDTGGSGIKQVTLWVKEGETGTWTNTGLTSPDPSGSFEFVEVLGDGAYHFAITAEDMAGNQSPTPTGDGAAVAVLDSVPPEITLIGASVISKEVGDLFIDPGAEATDNIDGDLTSAITVQNPVDTSTPGEYTITYDVTDSAGNAAPTVTRTVVVSAESKYVLRIEQPPSGIIRATPSPDSDGGYEPGTTVLLTYVQSADADYDVVAWNGADVDATDPSSAMVLMDQNRTVSVELNAMLGLVQVAVTPDNASWTVTDSDGGVHPGQGDQTLNEIPAGDVSIEYDPLEGYATPAADSGVLASNDTLLFEKSYQPGDSYVVSAPVNLKGKPGDTVNCPILVSKSDDLSRYAITITFDESLVEAVGVQAGTLTPGWGTPSFDLAAGGVTVSNNGDSLLGGSGSLAVLRLRVKDSVDEAGETEIAFASASLNGGDLPTTDQPGKLGVLVGSFVWGDANDDNAVNALDATTLLRYRVGLLDELPVTANAGDPDYYGGANVSGEDPPTIGTYDAGLVLRKSEGLLNQFPADSDGDGMGPDTGDPVGGDDLSALLISQLDSVTTRTVRLLGGLQLEPGVEVTVPVSIDSGTRVLGYYFELGYNPQLLEFQGLDKGSLATDWSAPVIQEGADTLRVAAAGAKELSGMGSLAKLTFRVAIEAQPGEVTNLTMNSVELNDGLIPVEVQDSVNAPELAGITPESGALDGYSVVKLSGVNLAGADAVLFGDVPAPFLRYNASDATLTALTPPVQAAGPADVTVSALGQTSTLDEGFTYVVPDIYLSLETESIATVGRAFQAPVQMWIEGGANPGSISFVLNFDPAVFAATPTSESAEVVTIGNAGGLITEVRTRRPGELVVTIEGGGLSSGELCTVNLMPIDIGTEPEAIIHVSDVVASDGQAKSLEAGGGAARLKMGPAR